MTNRERSLLYLRNQAYWIARMADQLESGEPVDCEWAVDLELPSYLKEEMNANELHKPSMA